MKHAIDTIIFDLGGVLVDWNPEYIYRNIFKGNESKMTWFLNNVCTPTWNLEQDSGRKIADGVALKIAEFPEYETEIKLFYDKWEFMFSGIIEENVQLFKQLKARKNYKLYALTNWCAEKWDKALELFPFFNEFDGVVVSGQEKCRKPFPEIYNILLNRFEITPENSIFIDDNFQNIIAAKKFNINGIHFKSDTNLKETLKLFSVNM
jgi:2-haloacid dehalogenase